MTNRRVSTRMRARWRGAVMTSGSLACMGIVCVTGCSRSDHAAPFLRMADPRVTEFCQRGGAFSYVSPVTVLGPPGSIDASGGARDGVWASGMLTVPPGACLRGVEVALGGNEPDVDVRLLLHLFEDAVGGRELPGFPASLGPGGRHTLPTSREVAAEKLRWRLEVDPSLSMAPASAPAHHLALWPLLADTLVMDSGFDSVEIGRETRPCLVFTPGTTARAPIPRGASRFETGIAALGQGCRVEVLVASPAGTTTVAMLGPGGGSWQDTTIALGDASLSSTLVLNAPPSGEDDRCLLLGDPLVRPTGVHRRAMPNVLLVSLDTVREDHFRPWEAEEGAGLGRLGPSFVVFRDATANSPVTDTSHLTLFSGLLVPRHTFWRETPTRPRRGIEPLASILAARGYRCGGFTDGGLVSASRGFSRGFDRYREYEGSPMDKTHVGEILHRAYDWIVREEQNGPWFAFAHTYQAHAPYRNHEMPAEPPVRISVKAWMREDTPLRAQTSLGVTARDDKSLLAIASTHYRSEVSYLTDRLSRFLENLDETDVLERTLVILFSDHGEGFGEHGLLGHNNSVYEEQLSVPLMIRFPGGRYGGTLIDGAVQLADVLPTVLDFLHIRPRVGLDGLSLMNAVRYGCRVPARPIISVQEWQCSVTRWPYKLIVGRSGIPARLFDLERDQGETEDILASTDEKVVRALKDALVDALVESDVGWMLFISRPRNDAPPLEVHARDIARWTYLGSVRGDTIRPGGGMWSIELAPSAMGDLMIMAPRLEGVRLRVAGGEAVPCAPGGATRVGPYVFRSIRCKGLLDFTSTSPGAMRVDLQSQLRELGYVE